nr:MAG TPA: MqsA [Caudoviricetes sp.]
MKFLGPEQKVEVKTKSIRNVEYLRCDECNKVIFPGNQYRDDECQYIKVHTWHSDWGRDSADSSIYRDLCQECASKFVSEYIKHLSGTNELELENCYLYINEKCEDFDDDDDDYDLVINDVPTNGKGVKDE